ncbi:MAG TPA: class I SAM-dependent methyltransferase [Terracidiphilus sp.]|nr:class I SAM-dependent methyltransferase [Terracidiphilus sp.]
MQAHWEKVYHTRGADRVSWFRAHLDTSLALIQHATQGDCSADIIDVGAGASTLVDDLLTAGYAGLTVLDISENALALARARLGDAGKSVRWISGDILQPVLPAKAYDVWHDRAVFHFLVDPAERAAYVRNVVRAVRPGGHVIVSTFGPQGPHKCSGLDVMRYDSATLHAEFGAKFKLVESVKELHETPSGSKQQFVYCHCMLLR